MTAMKLPPPALAVLAIGALWWLSQRRAVAAPVTGNPAYGQQAGLANGAVQRYNIPPSGITPSVASNPIAAGLQLLAGLVGSSNTWRLSSGASVPVTPVSAMPDASQSPYRFGGPSTGVYGIDQAIVRPADYQPTYTPDTQGEAAAQAYYLSNPDEFISNPPTLYNTSYSGIDPNSGWADNQ